MQVFLPNDVLEILSTIQNHGYEAYIVGGCVRDILLNKTPYDWDITTSAKPQQIKELFTHTIDIGIEHGTVTVRMNDTNYEVTTYRIESEYLDSRHPSQITFTNVLSEDLKRRDFTINAMAYNPNDGLIDLFNGQQDLQNKIIRCVGHPKERFEEDALRMLRALRFRAQLDFTIEEETLNAISQCAHLLSNISAERIQVELKKLLLSEHPEYIEQLYTSGVSKVILPELDIMMETPQNNPHHCYSVGKHTIEALKHIPSNFILRYTILFHDLGKPACRTTDSKGIDHFRGHQNVSVTIAHDIMKRLKFDKHSMDLIERYVEHHDTRIDPTHRTVRKMISKIGLDLFPNLFLIQRADMLGQSEFQRAKKFSTLSIVERMYHKVLIEKDCLTIKDLAINGNDLLELGFDAGPQIGQILQLLLNLVLDHPNMNKRESLLTYCEKQLL